MQTLIFDIETNAIEDFATLGGFKTILCLSVYDPKSGKMESFKKDSLWRGLVELENADVIVGHNIVKFDIPIIKKYYPAWNPGGLVRDTVLLSRLFHTNMAEDDSRKGWVDRNLIGAHSLKSWGQRLGFAKDSFGTTEGAFDGWTQELQDYCEQDVLVTSKLYDYFCDKFDLSIEAVKIEHDFAECIQRQEMNGFGFDATKAAVLHTQLVGRRLELQDELQDLFPPKSVEMKTPQYYTDPETGMKYDKKGDAPSGVKARLVKGPLKVKAIPFNPNSRDQIAQGLIDKYGWKPTAKTPNGKPRIDEAVLGELDYPEAKVFGEYLMLGKRLGQLSDGSEAWLKVERDGRIHGSVITNGAVTGRCTHRKPNLAQVTSSNSPYGRECRSLFVPTEGWKLVGVDASGLELRCLAHYMGKYDEGEYAKVILDGDIHTKNQEAAGLETRSQAKTFIYAFLYGAGDGKIGSVVGGNAATGRSLKARFLSQTPGIARLKAEIDKVLEGKSELVGLDSRPLHIRSTHAALNTLLQSAGAVVMKKATTIADRLLTTKGIPFRQVAHIHDEIQYECPEEHAEELGKIVCKAITDAGHFFKFRCPLDGEYNVGDNWADTH